jgi:hypothetical protein
VADASNDTAASARVLDCFVVVWSQRNERSFMMMNHTDGWMRGWMGGGMWIWTVIAALVVVLPSALHAGAAFAQIEGASVRPEMGIAQTPQASTMTATGKTNPLAGGAEIFENLTEASPVLDAVGFKKLLSEFETLYPEISMRLSPERKMLLDNLVTGVRNAWRNGNRSAMAIQSVEAYRLLQESIDHSGQPVPVEVPLLDYAGFKLNALLLSVRPDWILVAKTTQEASTWWTAIRPQITDKSLRDAMDHTVDGIKDAAARKDPKLLRFAAKMDLILVDGLETFFSSHPATR